MTRDALPVSTGAVAPALTDRPVRVLVPAAGRGVRAGGELPKQYLPLAGRPLLAHTLQVLARTPGLAGIVLVTAPGDRHWPACVPPGVEVHRVDGAESRMHSVACGVAALADCAADDDWVLVHDAARPCLPLTDLQRLLRAVRGHPVGGLLARPVADTLKRAGPGEPATAAGTVARAGLWQALTPQVFRHALLRECLAAAAARGRLATDESQAVEWGGHAPLLVPGSPLNLKVTLPADLELAERLLGNTGGAV